MVCAGSLPSFATLNIQSENLNFDGVRRNVNSTWSVNSYWVMWVGQDRTHITLMKLFACRVFVILVAQLFFLCVLFSFAIQFGNSWLQLNMKGMWSTYIETWNNQEGLHQRQGPFASLAMVHSTKMERNYLYNNLLASEMTSLDMTSLKIRIITFQHDPKTSNPNFANGAVGNTWFQRRLGITWSQK